jgi:HSP20 family protein
MAAKTEYNRNTFNIISLGGTMFVTVKRYPTLFNNELDRLFDTDRDAGSTFSPAMDIAEHENEYTLLLAIPGVKKDDVKLHVENNVLTISGERKRYQLPEKASFVRNEIATGEFTRTVKLSQDIDTEQISAELNDGVLKIVLPKQEAAKPRTITIN